MKYKSSTDSRNSNKSTTITSNQVIFTAKNLRIAKRLSYRRNSSRTHESSNQTISILTLNLLQFSTHLKVTRSQKNAEPKCVTG